MSRVGRGVAAAAVLASLVLGAVPAGAQTLAKPSQKFDELVPPGVLDQRPAGHRLNGYDAIELARKVPKVAREIASHKTAYPGVYMKGPAQWQVGYYVKRKPPEGPKELAQVTIDDASATVIEAWTSHQVAWTMARGYPGAFGRKVNSPWVWIPLSVLFVLPFVQPRRWRRMLHLDLLVLSGFGVSVAYFNDARIDVSVPLVYPLMAYLLVRLMWIGLRARDTDGPEAATSRGVALLVPVSWLAIALVFLIGFRVGLNVTSSNVIDVGYAGVIGAQKIVDGDPIYGAFPKDNEHGDTYGPVVYEAYIPFEQVFPWAGKWDDLPAAHAAAIVFDLLTILLAFLLGRRVRGPALGVALAYAWAAYPFTLYAMNSASNDTLVPVLVLGALLAAGPGGRGALSALAGLTKFAALALAPLLALHPRRSLPRFAIAFGLASLVAMAPVLIGGESLETMYDRTLRFQSERGSPFSIWGMYELDGLQRAWQAIAVAIALSIPFFPRRRDAIGLAACTAAILLALQMGVTHWFYLYLVWILPFAMLAMLTTTPEAASTAPGPARSSPPVADASSGSPPH